MMPMLDSSVGWLPAWGQSPHRSTALRHAAAHGRPGLWWDDPARPSSLLWLREGDGGRWEAFAAGQPGPAVDWLAGRSGGRPVALMAPPSWEGPIRDRGGRLDRGEVVTWVLPRPTARRSAADARPLGPDDAPAFLAAAPPWALRSWADYAAMIDRGAAFGVPWGDGFASIAWTYESDPDSDKLGVATADRFRRLGLGRASASSLVDHVLRARIKRPLWTTHADNPASMALARSLGFASQVVETLLHWTPPGASPEDRGAGL